MMDMNEFPICSFCHDMHDPDCDCGYGRFVAVTATKTPEPHLKLTDSDLKFLSVMRIAL